jgi:ribosome-associated protein
VVPRTPHNVKTRMTATGPVRDHGGMSEPVHVRGSVSIPEAELLWRFSRSSGPGGQHVNTSDSQVELRFDLAKTPSLPDVWRDRALERLAARLVGGVLTVRASEHRSQWRNREVALARLSSLLAQATAPPPRPRKPTKPTRGMIERRLENKRRRSETKRNRSGRFDH